MSGKHIKKWDDRMTGLGQPSIEHLAHFRQRGYNPVEGAMMAEIADLRAALALPAGAEQAGGERALPLLPSIPQGDRFEDENSFRLLGRGGNSNLYECWDDAIYKYAQDYAHEAVRAALASRDTQRDVALTDAQIRTIKFAADALEGLDYEDTAGELRAIAKEKAQ